MMNSKLKRFRIEDLCREIRNMLSSKGRNSFFEIDGLACVDYSIIFIFEEIDSRVGGEGSEVEHGKRN